MATRRLIPSAREFGPVSRPNSRHALKGVLSDFEDFDRDEDRFDANGDTTKRAGKEDDDDRIEDKPTVFVEPWFVDPQRAETTFKYVPDGTTDDTRNLFLHVVTPADTLGGLELRYGVSSCLIRRMNNMSSDRLTSYLVLKIPCIPGAQAQSIKHTLVSSDDIHNIQLRRLFRMRFPNLSEHEANFYLKDSSNDIDRAICSCAEDLDWQQRNRKLFKETRVREKLSTKARRKSVLSWLQVGLRKAGGISKNYTGSNKELKTRNHATGKAFYGPTLSWEKAKWANLNKMQTRSSNQAQDENLNRGSNRTSSALSSLTDEERCCGKPLCHPSPKAIASFEADYMNYLSDSDNEEQIARV